jgi:DNA-directed RNA polymerase subunit RPC12/RpoP
MKYNSDTLLKYCNENNISLINDYSNINRESYIEFKCIECFKNFTKNFRQLVKTGAYCQECMTKIASDKIKNKKVK